MYREKSKEDREKEARECENRKTDLFTGVCPYTLQHHYHLNINNTVLNIFYEDTVKRRKLGHPPFSDSQRQAWEKCLWKFLRKRYMKYDPKYAREVPKELPQDEHISGKLSGWRKDFFKTFINTTLDVPEALELFAREEEKIDYKNC
ncbi:MAG: hypothetical protein K2J73_08110 [Oscillospiraceae bacterium]|nr:hypothetical protein [Oscillospiraceae bacterium]